MFFEIGRRGYESTSRLAAVGLDPRQVAELTVNLKRDSGVQC